MSKLIPLEFENQRIMTTKVLAEEYGTEENNIKNNFNNNKSRFVEGKHYFKLQGQELKEFKRLVNDIDEAIKFAPVLYLWTDRGAARHAKILDTDEAWNVYEELEENYFNPRANKPVCIEDVLIESLKEMKALKYEVQTTKAGLEEVKGETKSIRDIVSINSIDWKADCKSIVVRIAQKQNINYQDAYKEAYAALERRAGCQLNIRKTNKQKKMALEGVCKSKINKITKLDVIGDDKKLVECFLAIVKELAIKYGI